MRIFLTGATGFLGRATTLALRREGHEVLAWVRSPERGRERLGGEAELVPYGGGDAALRAALERCDAVVNLAGAPVLARWTARRRAELRASRVDLTARLVTALEGLTRRPRVLVSGSAVGWYGDRGAEELRESSPAGSGFLAQLCADWEGAARRAEALGLRVVLVRTGVVLGLDGGALVAMLPPFRAGAGGRIGTGAQYLPWIHVEDWVRIVLAALDDARLSGPLNATAPEPVTNREFTRELAAALGKKAFVPVPGLALRGLLGGAAEVLLASQRALPAALSTIGFRHAHPTLAGALHDLLRAGRPRIVPLQALPAGVDSPYLAAHAPTHELELATDVATPLAEAFRFFSEPANLALLTPLGTDLRIVASSGAPAVGATVDYRLRVGPVPLAWRTRFERWDPGERFVDVQERGPYRAWWHEHRFEARGAATRMHDRVLYALPLGALGGLAHRAVVATALGDIFAHRALAIRLRFGAPARSLD